MTALATDGESATVGSMILTTTQPTRYAVEVAGPSGRHLTTIDGCATIEDALDYWRNVRPGGDQFQNLDTVLFTDGETVTGRPITVGAELRHPITGALVLQFARHAAGWTPAAR